jgi:predicted RNase H-like nuclease
VTAVTVVGVDLAWGERAASGVVVVRDGVVVDSATVVTDDEIAALVPAEGPVTVAFDAPLVVPNDTGRRPCDAAISRCFARFHAGAYPANRTLPWLREPRAGRLAARLGLATDLAADRVAVEVYPHAAAVVLFGLDRVLPYKRRSGRTLDDRRAAALGLTEAIAGLGAADLPLDVAAGPRWSGLVTAVADAPSQAALDRVEDELDAHLCAYVGALLMERPQACDVVGDPAEGAIVVPASPRTSPCLAADA